MTDMINFHSFPKAEEAEESAPTVRPVLTDAPRHAAIGRVVEIGGGGGKIEFDPVRLQEVSGDPAPATPVPPVTGAGDLPRDLSPWGMFTTADSLDSRRQP